MTTPKAPGFENDVPEVAAVAPRTRLVFGADYWCRQDNPHEMVLDGSAEVDRLEWFDAFCRSHENPVQVVRIQTFHWAMYKQQVPALAAALGALSGLRQVYFCKFSHDAAEYDVVSQVLLATRNVVEHVSISCDNDQAFGNNHNSQHEQAWCHALRQCEQLRVLHLDCRAGILLNALSKVPLYNPHLQEVCLRSARVTQTLQAHDVQYLVELPFLERIKLERFVWTPQASQVLTEFFDQASPHLTHLELPHCRWDGTATSMPKNFLVVLPITLEHLNLRDCQLNDVDLHVLSKRIMHTPRLVYLNLADNPTLTDSSVCQLWNTLPKVDSMRHLDLQRTNLSPATVSQIIKEKPTFPSLQTLHVDRNDTSRPWTAEECHGVAQTLVQHATWVDLGEQWEAAHPDQPLWHAVDRLLWLNRSGRAHVLAGHADQAEFLGRISADLVGTFLHLQHDAAGLGLFSSP